MKFDTREPLPKFGDRVRVNLPRREEQIGVVDRANQSWIWVRLNGPESQPIMVHPRWCSTLTGKQFV